MSKILVVKNGGGSIRTQMIEELLREAGHEVVYEMPEPEPLKIIMDEWNMVNGSTLNFSEIGRIDSISYFPAEEYETGEIVLFGGARGGGKAYKCQQKLEEWKKINLTQPEKKANIKPSTLLVKLIGRIYED